MKQKLLAAFVLIGLCVGLVACHDECDPNPNCTPGPNVSCSCD